jgi:branched-subunit amino acid transport protein
MNFIYSILGAIADWIAGPLRYLATEIVFAMYYQDNIPDADRLALEREASAIAAGLAAFAIGYAVVRVALWIVVGGAAWLITALVEESRSARSKGSTV